MYSRIIGSFGLLLFGAIVSLDAQGNQNSAVASLTPELSALPNKCVALRKGRTCFAKITLRFRVTSPGRYCVVGPDKSKTLYCESIERYGLFSFEFKSEKKLTFFLIDDATQAQIASTDIDVAWVHKKTSRKRRWRIF
ncbi:MAG: DUF3019 domain-containing protein [Psychrobium sp.]